MEEESVFILERGTATSSRIERWQLRAGDHIYAWRTRKINGDVIRIYSHHGIYESDEKVIQLTSAIPLCSVPKETCAKCREAMLAGGVVVYCLDCFLQGDELRLFLYGVPRWFYEQRRDEDAGLARQPTCSMEAEEPPEKVLRRANHLLVSGGGGFGGYDLLRNNCFHFAYYCKTGKRYYGLVNLVVDIATTLSAVPKAGRVVPPPPPPAPPSPPRRRRSPEPAARVPPRGRFLELVPRTDRSLRSPLDDPTPHRFFSRQTMFGPASAPAVVGSGAAAALFRMAPFFL